MKIEELNLKIFNSLEDLKIFIKKNFNVEEMEEAEHEPDSELDAELCFCDGDFDYSIYYMTGKSGRIIVVEVSKQEY